MSVATPQPPSLFGDVGALAEMRAFVASTRTALADVLVRTTTAGPGGSQVEQWLPDPTRSDLSANFAPAAAPSEQVAADAVQALRRFVVKLPPDTAVAETERIRLRHTKAHPPSPFVVSVLGIEPKANEVSRLVLCEWRTAGGA